MPAVFRFRYQTLLNAREHTEQQRQRELARLLNLRTQYIDRLRGLQHGIRETRQNLTEGLRGVVEPHRIAEAAHYALTCRTQGDQWVRRLAEIEAALSRARADLAEATRQRKALELLRDRQQAAWRKEQQRRETRDLDELASQRFTRAQRQAAN